MGDAAEDSDMSTRPNVSHRGMSEQEWQVRTDLAAAYRLAAIYGWTDLNNTHFATQFIEQVPRRQPLADRGVLRRLPTPSSKHTPQPVFPFQELTLTNHQTQCDAD